jgi:hypothetical protein
MARLASNTLTISFVPVIYRLAIRVIFFAATAFFINACASERQEALTESSAGPVPGEKLPDEGRVVPGAAPGANANVRW